MATMFERDQTGKYESWEEVVANVEAEETPFTSMIAKGQKPVDVIDNWQAKKYPKVGHKGVADGKDAEEFDNVGRKRLQGVIQKTWKNPGVSDLAGEVKVHGIPDEMKGQVADALKLVKRQMEQRMCSNVDSRSEDDGERGYETRGALKWLSPTAQSDLPVPADYRPTTGEVKVDVAMDTITEMAFRTMMTSAYKLRRGSKHLTGFVGIDLKNQMDDWTAFQTDVSGKTAVRSLSMNAAGKQLIQVVDRLQFSAGTIDLHPTTYLAIDLDGEDTVYTHRSGMFLDMNMWKMSYVRTPRVVPLPYKGGGQKAIVDAIFILKCLNPLGHLAALCNSDS